MDRGKALATYSGLTRYLGVLLDGIQALTQEALSEMDNGGGEPALAKAGRGILIIGQEGLGDGSLAI